MKFWATVLYKPLYLLSAAIILCLVLSVGWLLRVAQSNYVMVVLADHLWQASASDAYRFSNRSLLDSLSENKPLQALNRQIKQLPALDGLIGGDWAAGRLALAVADTQAATRALSPLRNQALTNPFLYLDHLQAIPLSEVLPYQAQNPAPMALQAVSDTLAAAYFMEGTSQSLRHAYELRPQDIAISHALWQGAAADHSTEAQKYLAATQNVTADALDAAHPQLLLNTISLVPDLYAAGIWDRDTTSSVVRYLVWRHPSTPEVADMVQALVDQDPAQYDWILLLAELSVRQGLFEPAEELYGHVLARDAKELAGSTRYSAQPTVAGYRHLDGRQTGRGDATAGTPFVYHP